MPKKSTRGSNRPLTAAGDAPGFTKEFWQENARPSAQRQGNLNSQHVKQLIKSETKLHCAHHKKICVSFSAVEQPFFLILQFFPNRQWQASPSVHYCMES
jgi:hypothetical protein